jgi:hypothetical protein
MANPLALVAGWQNCLGDPAERACWLDTDHFNRDTKPFLIVSPMLFLPR